MFKFWLGLPAGLSWDKVLSLSKLGGSAARQGVTHFSVVGRVDLYNALKAVETSQDLVKSSHFLTAWLSGVFLPP